MRVYSLAGLLCLLATPALADDGSWNATYDLVQGPLYAVDGNPSIELSKELLVLEDMLTGQVEARFELRNTTRQAITVEAGFPVVLDVPFSLAYEHKNGAIKDEATGRPVWLLPFGKYGGEIDDSLLALAGLKTRKWSPGEDDFEVSDRYIRDSDFVKRRLEKPVPRKTPFSFTITQDGKPVALTSLVVETDPRARPPIVFHFRHQLVFAPGATSIVKVRYKAPTLAGGEYTFVPRLTHVWKYVLATGATWKGPLGQLVLAIPEGVTCENDKAWTALGRWAGYRVYARAAFEPTAADDLSCGMQRADDDEDAWDRFWFADKPEAEVTTWAQAKQVPAHVVNPRASSSVGYRSAVYSECCVIKDSPNTAEAAFDGLLETAWSEGSKTDEGEFVELELSKPAAGLRIMSGFLGARHVVSGERAGKKQKKLLADLYKLNSRPKRLELTSLDGSIKVHLDLHDRPGVWNVFPLRLPAGSYRFTIRSIYKGKRWQDTSIGEIEFMTVPKNDLDWLDGLRKDAFFAPFFADMKDGPGFAQPALE